MKNSKLLVVSVLILPFQNICNTLEVKPRPVRRCGNTTRQVDFAVQKLLDGYTVICKDHCNEGKNQKMNKELIDLIIKRLIFLNIDTDSQLIIKNDTLRITDSSFE